jgi:hypothetical protein
LDRGGEELDTGMKLILQLKMPPLQLAVPLVLLILL